MNSDVAGRFNLNGKTAIITGGAGLLGQKHAEALASSGTIPILIDKDKDRLSSVAESISEAYKVKTEGIHADITKKESWEEVVKRIQLDYGRIDILINNAANNPKVEKDSKVNFSRMENFTLEQWNEDFAVGVTGAFLACQAVGKVMVKQKKGVIVNIASDLAVIAPDQRIYREDGLPEDRQNVKPVTYSVVKHALIGLTKYLATYWADAGIRVNAISPGGVYVNQPREFVEKLEKLIPIGRMANSDEYQSAILFLCSDASSYMTGHNLILDGGRSVW